MPPIRPLAATDPWATKPNPQQRRLPLLAGATTLLIALFIVAHPPPWAEQNGTQTEQGTEQVLEIAPRVQSNNQRSYRQYDTAHFRFQYHKVDQRMIEEVAPDIEMFAFELARDLGIDPLLDDKKLTIRIENNTGAQQIEPFYMSMRGETLVVLSQRRLSMPVGLTDTDALRQSIYAGLAYRSMTLALEQHAPQSVWQPMVDGLMQWAYLAHSDLYASQGDELHRLLRQRLAGEAPVQLPILAISSPPVDPEATLIQEWKQNVLAKTVTDYVIATHGRASLSDLLVGMHRYDTWQSLIPSLYGVTLEEFERGWQAYLAAHPMPDDKETSRQSP